MWNIYLKRLSFLIFYRRTLTTNTNSVINKIIKNLSINYKKELEQLQINEHASSIERIHYLKTILQKMILHEKILQDIDETNKLSNGNNNK